MSSYHHPKPNEKPWDTKEEKKLLKGSKTTKTKKVTKKTTPKAKKTK
jgi:hypothetical protein